MDALAAHGYRAYLARAACMPLQVRRYVYGWLLSLAPLWTLLWLDFARVDVLVITTLAVHTPLYFLVIVPLSARWSSRRMVRAAEDD